MWDHGADVREAGGKKDIQKVAPRYSYLTHRIRHMVPTAKRVNGMTAFLTSTHRTSTPVVAGIKNSPNKLPPTHPASTTAVPTPTNSPVPASKSSRAPAYAALAAVRLLTTPSCAVSVSSALMRDASVRFVKRDGALAYFASATNLP